MKKWLCKLFGCDSGLTEVEAKEILKGLRAHVNKLKGVGIKQGQKPGKEK